VRGKSAPVPDRLGELPRLQHFRDLFVYTGRAFALVIGTSRPITLWLAALSVAAGLLPGAIAYVGKLIVDAVVLAARTGGAAGSEVVFSYVALELGLVVLLAAAQRGLAVCESLLRALLGQRIN
jgi:ATP-binding cassette subfamily B protein